MLLRILRNIPLGMKRTEVEPVNQRPPARPCQRLRYPFIDLLHTFWRKTAACHATLIAHNHKQEPGSLEPQQRVVHPRQRLNQLRIAQVTRCRRRRGWRQGVAHDQRVIAIKKDGGLHNQQ